MARIVTALIGCAALYLCLPFPAPADDYSVTETPLSLEIFYRNRTVSAYDEDWPVERRAAELTGVSLKNSALVVENGQLSPIERLIRSGGLPDIIAGPNLKDYFHRFGPQGAFVQLDRLIPEHAPNLHSFFAAHPQLLKSASAYDGHLYHIPFFPDGKFAGAYFIRQDWLVRLGLKQPQNVHEVYKTLQAFKKRDPNGNGLADEIPFFAKDLGDLLRILPLWDARSSGSDSFMDFYLSDEKVLHGFAQPEFRIAMRELAKWHREGLLDPQLVATGSGDRDHIMRSNTGGMSHGWFASTSAYNLFLADQYPGFRFLPFAPPASISGRRVEEHRRSPMRPDGWAITYSNAHPVETIKYFDFWFTPLGRRLANFGVEGVHYDLIDGREIFKPEILEAKKPVVQQMREIGAQLFRGFHQDYFYEEQWTNEIARQGIELYSQGDYLLDFYFGSSLNEREQSVYDRYWPDIKREMRARVMSWIQGEGDVDDEWDQYLDKLDELGLQKVLDVLSIARWREAVR